MVTRCGELLDRDGRLVVGPHDSDIGLISRRAELRDIEQQAAELEGEIEKRAAELDGQKEQLTQRQRELNRLIADKQLLAQTLSKLELKVATASERAEQFRLQRQQNALELEQARLQLEATEEQLRRSRQELSQLESDIRTLEELLGADREATIQLEEQLQIHQLEVTQWEVEVAKSEQRVEALRLQRAQVEQDQRDREELWRAAAAEVARQPASLSGSRTADLERPSAVGRTGPGRRTLRNRHWPDHGAARFTEETTRVAKSTSDRIAKSNSRGRNTTTCRAAGVAAQLSTSEIPCSAVWKKTTASPWPNWRFSWTTTSR